MFLVIQNALNYFLSLPICLFLKYFPDSYFTQFKTSITSFGKPLITVRFSVTLSIMFIHVPLSTIILYCNIYLFSSLFSFLKCKFINVKSFLIFTIYFIILKEYFKSVFSINISNREMFQLLHVTECDTHLYHMYLHMNSLLESVK